MGCSPAQQAAGLSLSGLKADGRIDQKYRLPVYPIAFFSHDSPSPEPDSYRIIFPDRDVLRFRFRTIQLKWLRWRKFVRQPNPVASALMAKNGLFAAGASSGQTRMPAPLGHLQTLSRQAEAH
jgi:hypothetical protein